MTTHDLPRGMICSGVTTGTIEGYMPGFGNDFETEALPGALPQGQNSPQKCNYGLYAEQLSGTAFTAPRGQNERTWCYRIRPSVRHTGDFAAIEVPYWKTAPHIVPKVASLGQYRWDPVPVGDEELTWITGMRTVTTAGDVNTQVGMASHIYLVTESMQDEYFFSADSELLVVPQEGRLRFCTELGLIDLEPKEIAIIPRGLVYRVEVLEGPCRGFVCENYGQKFDLPGRGPIGANCMANAALWQPPPPIEGDVVPIGNVLVSSKGTRALIGMAIERTPWWTWAWPAVAWVILLTAFFAGAGGFVASAAGVALIATVFAAVYHAEVVAHRTGEPFGTLVLAVAVTVIEVALIVSVMVAAPAEKAGLARDTVFAAVMIVMNGIVGLCLLWGGARHQEQQFQLQAASAALAVLAALTTLTLVLPNVVAETGPLFTTSQLIFAGTVSLVLYGSFVFVQTVRHRDYFLPLAAGDGDAHAPPPSNRTAAASAGMLLFALVAVVGLAKALTPTVEAGIAWAGVPKAVVGIVIAAVVLLPECLASLRAARANQLQTSLNLALGSALATIGLTIPTVALVSIVIGQPLELGLGEKDQVLLALTLIISVITLGTGRTTVLQGILHLVIFAVFLFFAVVP